MKRKIASILLSCTMFLAPARALAFTDTDNHWSHLFVDTLSEQDILAGYGDDSYKPNNNITREEATTLVFKTGTKPVEDIQFIETGFKDVAPDRWSAQFIAALKDKKIIEGYEDGSFKPSRNVTRAEFATMVFKNMSLKNESLTASDIADVKNHWSEKMVANLVSMGIISGYPDHTFKPDQTITRGEAAAVIYKAMDYEKTLIKLPVTNTFQKAIVTRVVDGDTVKVDIDGKEFTVRMIGVDTPESVHPDPEKNSEFGFIASEYTHATLGENVTVWLQKDVSETDRYGRLLRYVWMAQPRTDEPNEFEIRTKMFNAVALIDGYAQVSTYPPDVKYSRLFTTLNAEARTAKVGLYVDVQPWPTEPTQPTKPVEPSKPTQPTQPVVSPKTLAYTIANGRIIGHTGSRIYHRSNQQSYKKILMENAVFFDSFRDAEAAGYRAAKR